MRAIAPRPSSTTQTIGASKLSIPTTFELRTSVRVPTGSNTREFEAEGKILEYLAAYKVKPNSTGTVTLFSQLPLCESCGGTDITPGLVGQFRQAFPNVTLKVSSGP